MSSLRPLHPLPRHPSASGKGHPLYGLFVDPHHGGHAEKLLRPVLILLLVALILTALVLALAVRL